MKKTRLIQIDWQDSCMWGKTWDNIEDVIEAYREEGMDLMKSVGYLVDETKEYVIICQSLHFDRGEKTVSRGCEFFVIPKGCILKITNL